MYRSVKMGNCDSDIQSATQLSSLNINPQRQVESIVLDANEYVNNVIYASNAEVSTWGHEHW